MTRTDKYLRIALIPAGLAMIACTVVLGRYNSLQTRSNQALPMPYLGNRPVHQLTLARSDTDIRTIVGTPPDQEAIRAIETGNHIDNRYFIPLYTTVLVLIIVITGRGEARLHDRVRLALIALVAGAALLDVMENRGVARVVDHVRKNGRVDGLSADFWPYAVAKWSLLALVFLGVGAMNLLQRTYLRRIGGVLMLATGISFAVDVLAYTADRLGFGWESIAMETGVPRANAPATQEGVPQVTFT